MLAPTDFFEKITEQIDQEISYWGVMDQIGVKKAKVYTKITLFCQ